jgi:excisionase family DNA binding protein
MVSIAQAAQILGKSQATIRRWAAQKTIPALKSKDGTWSFNREELIAHMSANAQSMIESKTIRRSPNQDREHQVITVYERQIDALERTIDRERKINDELREQVRQSQGEILKLTHEIRSILSNENKATLSRWIKSTAKEVFSKSTN